MGRLSSQEKLHIQAKIIAFDFSSFESRLSIALCQHHKSFHGRDFKILAQVAPFIFWDVLSPMEKAVWMKLSEVKTWHDSIWYNFFLDFPVCILLYDTCGWWERHGRSLLGVSEGIWAFTITEAKVSSAPPFTFKHVQLWTNCCLQCRKVILSRLNYCL